MRLLVVYIIEMIMNVIDSKKTKTRIVSYSGDQNQAFYSNKIKIIIENTYPYRYQCDTYLILLDNHAKH